MDDDGVASSIEMLQRMVHFSKLDGFIKYEKLVSKVTILA